MTSAGVCAGDTEASFRLQLILRDVRVYAEEWELVELALKNIKLEIAWLRLVGSARYHVSSGLPLRT